jgi:hypothetical protein
MGALRFKATLVALVAVPLIVVGLGSALHDVSPGRFTRDLALLAKVHPLTGFLSSLGILLWAAAAAIWLFTAYAAPRERAGRLAIHAGCLSAYLCLDDLFMIHEQLAPEYLGVPEKVVYAALGFAVLSFLWAHRRALLAERATRWLAGALGALGLSALLDALLGRWLWRIGEWNYLVEDGLKWTGACLWCAFAVVWCRHVLSARAA